MGPCSVTTLPLPPPPPTFGPAQVWRWKRRPDADKARLLLNRGQVEEAAELGSAEAAGILAERYLFGEGGLARDGARFAAWARRAAEGGDARGQFRLARALHLGGVPGLPRDHAAALAWYEAALQQVRRVPARLW